MTTNELNFCPLCKFNNLNANYDFEKQLFSINCETCGKYRITDEALDLKSYLPSYIDKHYILSATIKNETLKGKITEIYSNNIEDILRLYPVPEGAIEKRNLILKYVEKNANHAGGYIHIHGKYDFNIAYAKNPEEFSFLLQSLVKKSYLENPGAGRYKLTIEGWEYLESLSNAANKENKNQHNSGEIKFFANEVADLEEKKNNRIRFLHELYKMTDGDSLEHVVYLQLGGKLGFTKEETSKIINFLSNEYLIEEETNEEISISHNGVIEIEKYLDEYRQNNSDSRFPEVNISQTASKIKNQFEKDVFISYASEDREIVAKPIAELLTEQGYSVWFDRYELLIGDSLRRTIEDGLRKSRFGVTILSHDFFKKEWPQKELDGLFSLEQGKKKILPVWHNLTKKEIIEYSPFLADKLGIPTSDGIEKIVQDIIKVIKRK